MPRQSKRVDEIKRGAYRARFLGADMQGKNAREKFAEETNMFAPTSYEESLALLELKNTVGRPGQQKSGEPATRTDAAPLETRKVTNCKGGNRVQWCQDWRNNPPPC